MSAIVAATVLFVVGTTIERNQGENHSATEETTHGGEAARGEPAASESTSGEESGSEEILGVDPESAALVAIAAGVSLLLAAAVWRWPDRGALLLLVAAAMLAFAALDVREVVHQIDENRSGLAVLAAFVALLHLGSAAASGALRQAG